MPHDITTLVKHLTDDGITSASVRKLVQFTPRTRYTSDRAQATLMQLQTLWMSAKDASTSLYRCRELLIFPPETLPSRLENVHCLTAMSHSEANHMVWLDACCLRFSNKMIIESVTTLAGECCLLHFANYVMFVRTERLVAYLYALHASDAYDE